MRIAAKHPVRAAVARIPTYHTSKGSAFAAVYAACKENGVELVGSDWDGDEGYVNHAVRPENGAHVICDCCAEKAEKVAFDNWVVCSWYTMRPGCVELVTYVS